MRRRAMTITPRYARRPPSPSAYQFTGIPAALMSLAFAAMSALM